MTKAVWLGCVLCLSSQAAFADWRPDGIVGSRHPAAPSHVQLALLAPPGHPLADRVPVREPDVAPEWQFRAFPLHAAALENDRDRVIRLVEGGIEVDAHDRYGKTPLMVASAFGNVEAAKALLDLGADIEARDRERSAVAVHYAARAGHVGMAMARLLLARGADLDLRTTAGETALHVAAYYNHAGMIELLVEGGAAIDAADNVAVAPLQYARREGRAKAVDMLLRLGARVDGLHDAVNAGDLIRVRELLAGGVPVDQLSLSGTALHLASAQGRVAIAAALIDAGADLEAEGDPVGAHPLHVAAVTGQADLAALLMEHGADIEARDAEGRTPLMVAAAFANDDVAALLVRAGADISTVDSLQMAAIHHAAASGDADLVSLLLARGVDVNLRNSRSGMAPLHYAAGFGSVEVLGLLARHGGDMSLRDGSGSTPYDHASRCRAFAAMDLLRRLAAE